MKMTIDEAIENFKNMLTFIGPEDLPKSRISLKLAIEAFKAIKAARKNNYRITTSRLPGETAD